jgi:hypothetical protein
MKGECDFYIEWMFGGRGNRNSFTIEDVKVFIAYGDNKS